MKVVAGFVLLLVFIQITALESASNADDEELIEVLKEVVEVLKFKEVNKEDFLDRAIAEVEQEQEHERKRSHVGVDTKTSKLHAFLKSSPEVRRVSLAAKIQQKALQEYKKTIWDKRAKKGATTEDFFKDAKEYFGGSVLQKKNVVPKVPSNQHRYCPLKSYSCDKDPNADVNLFRTFDGSCNNLKTTEQFSWGAANTAQMRVLAGKYNDVLGDEIRQSVDGTPLPSARQISKEVLGLPTGEEAPTNKAAKYILMTIGQFLDHDITHTPVQDITCDCSTTTDCIPIDTQGIDSFRDCITFARSELYLPTNCPTGQRMFANTITAWVDGSNIYGSSQEEAEKLYDQNSGKMITEDAYTKDKKLKPFLPYDAAATCEAAANYMKCFKAGDVRQNENIALTAMHTVFMRYHNFIVDQLEENRFTGSGKEKYQVARRIVGAVWQHIVYKEYLPVILGTQDIAKDFDIKPSKEFFNGYDATVNPDISVVFSTAAFRFGHTEINDLMLMAHSLTAPEEVSSIELHKVFFNPTVIYQDGIDKIMLGLIMADIGGWDNKFAEEVRERLFQGSNETHGLDLPALNIQRGRDHGLASYVHWRKYCGIDTKTITTWDELRKTGRGTINRKIIETLKNLYSSVEDIDLFPAAISERPAPNARVGPTFACLIADQFRKLKVGDRFFYENTGVLTTKQLKEIQKASLTGILCETLDNPGDLPQNVFKPVATNNPSLSCSRIRNKGIQYKKLV